MLMRVGFSTDDGVHNALINRIKDDVRSQKVMDVLERLEYLPELE